MISLDVETRYSLRRRSDGKYPLIDYTGSSTPMVVGWVTHIIHYDASEEDAWASIDHAWVNPGPNFRGQWRLNSNDMEIVVWKHGTVTYIPDWEP